MSGWLIAQARAVLDWIDRLPPGRQNLTTGLILVAIGGALSFLVTRTVGGAYKWLHRRREREALRRSDAAARRRERATLGLYDHLENAMTALSRVPALITTSLA